MIQQLRSAADHPFDAGSRITAREEKLAEITEGLISCALTEQPIMETFRSLAGRLLDCDIPVHRINCSTFQRRQFKGGEESKLE